MRGGDYIYMPDDGVDQIELVTGFSYFDAGRHESAGCFAWFSVTSLPRNR